MRFLIILSLLLSASCDKAKNATNTARLLINNNCEVDIWIQQQNFPGPALVHLEKGKGHSYDIPAEGLASTRFWPKLLCDSDGNNCAIGQSSDPCPAHGCAPPVDSKLEATWGCTLADKTQCGYTPQGVQMIDTFWNASAVDGWTIPFSVSLQGGDGRASCIPVGCAGLATAECPTDDNLSDNGMNPMYSSESLHTTNPATGGYAGCFSPCTKLNYPGWGGLGLNDPSGPVELLYCCPGPIADECRAGPVVITKYVETVHTACNNTTYAYAYDDGIGGRNCSGDTVIQFDVGPNCVEVAAK